MDPYTELIEKAGGLIFKSPRASTTEEIDILKQLITPEEAKVAGYLSHIPETIATIADKAQKDTAYLRSLLEAMFHKRVILQVYTEEPRYSLVSLSPGVNKFEIGRTRPEDILQRWARLTGEKMGAEGTAAKIGKTRVRPVNKTVLTEMRVHTYQEVEGLVEKADAITLLDCYCRTLKANAGEKKCHAPVQNTCIYLNGWAERLAENGVGTRVSKEVARQTLLRNREEGLIYTTYDGLDGVYGICSCCACCCVLFQGIYALKVPGVVAKSDYTACLSPDECTGCGACVDLCQMDAISLINGTAKIHEDRCIGCGVCEAICEFGAIRVFPLARGTILPC